MPAGRLAIERTRSTSVTIDGRELALFAGCNYLGLAQHHEVVAALRAGLDAFGVSSAGSRETTGNTVAHDELELALAQFLGLDAALLVPDGYLSNLVLAQGIAADVRDALVDREAHVSVRDALAATGMRSHAFAFCDPSDAARVAMRERLERFAVFTDGAYPVMKGIAPLPRLLELLPGEGLLVVDDCHGLGVLGAHGRGTAEHWNVVDRRLVVTGTLSKGLGVFGGFVAGARATIDRCRERSHAYVGSTPIPPALARASLASLRVLEREPERVARLHANVERARAGLRAAGLDVHDAPLPVFAFALDSHERMERVYAALVARGVLVPYVRYPDSLGGYFRCALSSEHTSAQIDRLVDALRGALSMP